MVNYFRHFIPNIVSISGPLSDVLKGKPKSLPWNAELQSAFKKTKVASAKATMLAFVTPGAPLQLTTDASNTACGATLEQVVNGALHPIAFLRKNSTVPSKIIVFSTESSFQSKNWKKNPVADALSRIEINAVHLVIHYEDLTHEQQLDPETPAYQTAITALKWEDVPLRTTANIISSKFIWHGMKRDITRWARSGINCQTSKISRHTTSEIGNFKQPMRRFGHVHIDIVDPLRPSGGDRFLLTAIARSTRWIEAIPMQDSSTPSCVHTLLLSWISRFGVPDDITADITAS
ncbi:uncharacterized protein [Palaemon carinicauda]|uniref:uncharacterized protein n=1 Tax=Palaemon carinicauda TaxID=392227 RepID=UPI0035B5D620